MAEEISKKVQELCVEISESLEANGIDWIPIMNHEINLPKNSEESGVIDVFVGGMPGEDRLTTDLINEIMKRNFRDTYSIKMAKKMDKDIYHLQIYF